MEDAYLHPELKSCFRRYIRLLQFTSRELRKRQLRPYVSAEELAESGLARYWRLELEG
jgi:hypothetical protein